MRITVKYEDAVSTYDVEADELWVTLSQVEGVELEEDCSEESLQEAFNVVFNRPDYNNYHTHTRHNFEYYDEVIYTAPEQESDYEDTCAWIRKVLNKKPDLADMFIAIRIDGMPIREYAARTGVNENNITQKLKRATKNLKKAYENRQI